MDSRTYIIGGRKKVVTDKNILDVVEKVENLEISPGEASEQLKEYLLSDKSCSVSEYFGKISLWEAIVVEFDIPCRGRATSLVERYAEKHGLSGNLQF